MMLRRRRLLQLSASLPLASLCPRALYAADFDPEGKYDPVKPPQPTDTPGKVEIVDVFWYGCPHCYRFLPVMDEYAQTLPENAELRRMPAVFRESWAPHARAFYTAQLLGVVDKVHRAIFDAIHRDKRTLDTREELMVFFEEHGVDKDAFGKTYDSFAVETLVRKSVVMQGRYGVRGTPSVIVNGKYRVSGGRAGSYENMVKVIESLVGQEEPLSTA